MSSRLASGEQINLVFKSWTHAPVNLRDHFINTVKNPLQVLNRRADRHHVLKGLDFKVEKGDRIALLGINGAGKTSFCRLLSGVMHPTSGKINRPIDTRAIFQANLVLYPELTGRENAQLLVELIFPFESRTQRQKLLASAIEFADLGPAIDTAYRTYSTGMQTRLMLSLVTARPAELLILDEAFDGADIFWQKKIAQRTRDLIEKSGALIFVSHNLEVLKTCCKSAWLLQDGRLQAFDSLEAGIEEYTRQNAKR